MERRHFLRIAGGGLMAGAAYGQAQTPQSRPERRPNILWITCEDISPNLGCYGDPEATTPNLDRLASEGIRYDLAFSIAGVCAPSRSCLITGMYPTTLGTCHMRCNNPPPDNVKCFPEYLRDAGYFCTNNVKTDYNFPPPPTAWDELSKTAHWRHRREPEQPFFAVFNFTITHESQVGTLPDKMGAGSRALLAETHHDPDRMVLPPYYPDTPVVRRHWAHYYDLITAMDRQAGEVLDQLEQDGLAENTVVFFYSDHGVGLPRAKRWMYDSGLHVPLIIRWPGHYEFSTHTGRLVSFVDFAPTVLSLAGVPIPGHMQGKPFLGGQEAAPRTYIHAARDRMDERYDMIRAVRDKRYKYIRNYEPDRPYDQYLSYPESFPFMQELRRVQKAGELKGPELQFFRQRKPLEELFDTESDPHEINNLADSPDHAEILARMRGVMDGWMMETRDLGAVPEFALGDWLKDRAQSGYKAPGKHYAPLPESAKKLTVYGKPAESLLEDLNGADRLRRLWAAKTLGLLLPATDEVLIQALNDPDECVAFWAARAFGNRGRDAASVREALQQASRNGSTPVRVAAARALYKFEKSDEALVAIREGLGDPNPFVRLRAVQALDELGDPSEATREALQKAVQDENDYVKRVATHALGA